MITYLDRENNCETSVAILLLKTKSLLIKRKNSFIVNVMTNGSGLSDTLVLKFTVALEDCNTSLLCSVWLRVITAVLLLSQ